MNAPLGTHKLQLDQTVPKINIAKLNKTH